MISYKYVARDPATGQKVKSVVQADSEQAAANLIQKQGLAPISISNAMGSDTGFGKFTNRVKAKDKIIFSRQLATLINAGLPLVQSLRTVGNQSQSKPLQLVVSEIIGDVEAGTALSIAMAKHPKVFNQIYIGLIAAGEASGTLDKALERLATQQEKDAEILSKVRGAMIYPAVVLFVMFGVMGFMVIKVLPQVEVIYTGIPGSGELPFVTRFLLAIAHFVMNSWIFVLIGLGLMIFFGTRWFRTMGGRRVADKAKMRAWPIGQLFMKLYMARFARTATTLVGTGVPLIQTLEITADSINNVHVADSINRAIEKVKAGKSLSESIRVEDTFLTLVPDMLQVGEQSGAIEEMLDRVAIYYEKEVDTQIRNVSTIIEPVLMILLGMFAITIVVAVLLPIYGLANKIH